MNINTSILIDTHMDTLNHQVKALMGTLRGGGGGGSNKVESRVGSSNDIYSRLWCFQLSHMLVKFREVT